MAKKKREQRMGKPSYSYYNSRRFPTTRIVAVALCHCVLLVGRGHLPAASSSSCIIQAVTAFQQQQSPIFRRNSPGVAALFATTQPSSPDPDERRAGSSSNLVTTQSQSSQVLLSAFANLDLSDQYDAVLSSACAKILDEPAASKDQVVLKLNDCQRLLQEMNDAKVAASPRSMMALVDVRTRFFLSVIE